jgi:hypothetical protein
MLADSSTTADCYSARQLAANLMLATSFSRCTTTEGNDGNYPTVEGTTDRKSLPKKIQLQIKL